MRVIPGSRRWFASLLLLILAGCTGASGPPFPQVAPTIPPLAADRARLYFYREYEPYESLTPAILYLNGVQTGVSVPGGVFYRDVPPGTYLIAPWSQGDFPNAAKTVVLRPGDTFYAKVLSLRAWQSGGGTRFQRDTFIVMLIDPAQAQRELANMRYVQPLTGAALHAAPSVAPAS
jgi:hypothetical protein